MSDKTEQAVLDAACRVFETSAFLSVYPCNPGDELPPPDHSATMTFHGAAEGRVSMRIAGEVLDLIVENLLDDDANGDAQQQRRSDVLKEMLNMVCGNLLTEYFGPEPVFDLSPPELLNSAELPAPKSEDVRRIVFNVENTLAEVMFEVQSQLNS